MKKILSLLLETKQIPKKTSKIAESGCLPCSVAPVRQQAVPNFVSVLPSVF